jgi:hypothetical protein
MTGLQELYMSNHWMESPREAATLSALSSLTALELSLSRWDEPFGPLPPSLKALGLVLLPDVFNPRSPTATEPIVYRPVYHREPFASPGLRASLTNNGTHAAPAVRTLALSFSNHFSGCDQDEPYQARSMHIDLTPDSIPCAFPTLEEFTYQQYRAGYDFRVSDSSEDEEDRAARDWGTVPQVFDLVALLEAAPGLRRVNLGDEITGVTDATREWLRRHRPGLRADWRPWSIKLELLPPGQ